MEKIKIISILCILFLISIPFSGCLQQSEPPSDSDYQKTLKNKLLYSISIGRSYLANITDETGMFVYEYDPFTNTSSTENYNILRHAGTIYSMMQTYNETKNTSLLEATQRAIGYLSDQIKPFNDTYCVVYNDEVKLGGSALAIIALAEYTKVTGDQQYLSTMNKLADYLILNQKPSGEFLSKRYYSTNEISSFVSSYYPGEAILALCRLYALTGDQSLLDTATLASEYLILDRDADVSIENLNHDHWLLMALNELYRFDQKQIYLDHAKKISLAIIDFQRNEHNRLSEKEAWLGSYYTPPRSTPTATRSEGLIASYQLLTDFSSNQSLINSIAYAINLSIHFQLRMQYTHQTMQEMNHSPLGIGGFKESVTDSTIRNDYVQHNICAIIGFYHLLTTDSSFSQNILSFQNNILNTELNCTILDSSLDNGIDFLIANQKPEGNFNYEYDFINQKQSNNDNEVRQAGALWSIGFLYRQRPSKNLLETFVKGFDFFKDHTVTSDNETQWIMYPSESSYGRTGTIALVCLSLIDFLRSDELSNDSLTSELHLHLDRYLNFLLTLRMKNGLFHQNYYHHNGSGFGDSSPYFDGEILLAMCKAYNYMDRTDLKEAIIETAELCHKNYVIEALQRDKDSSTTKGFFQWGIMSFYEMLQTEWEGLDEYPSIIIDLADWMIDVHRTLDRTRNTAYAYEGIIHAYVTAQQVNDRFHELKFKQVIDEGLYKLTSWQVGGPIPNEYLKNNPTTDPIALGGIMNHKEEPYLRIDVTQHQMHAVILALNHVYEC